MFAFRLLLAVLSGFAGAILMFPGLRYTRMHRDCLRSDRLNLLLKMVLERCNLAILSFFSTDADVLFGMIDYSMRFVGFDDSYREITAIASLLTSPSVICSGSSYFLCNIINHLTRDVGVARMSSESRAMQLVYHLSFVMPLINVLTWVRPLSRAYLTERALPSTGAPL